MQIRGGGGTDDPERVFGFGEHIGGAVDLKNRRDYLTQNLVSNSVSNWFTFYLPADPGCAIQTM